MEEFLYKNKNQLKNRSEIPDAEKVDESLSPVTQEEMDAELRLMQEATKEAEVDETELKSEAILAPEVEVNKEMEKPVETENSMQVGKVELAEADRIRIDALRKQLNAHAESSVVQNAPQEQMKPEPPEKPPERAGGDGDEELEPIIMNQLDHVEYETCRRCKGGGRVLFGLLGCPKCGGSGRAPALIQKGWKKKVVGYRPKGE